MHTSLKMAPILSEMRRKSRLFLYPSIIDLIKTDQSPEILAKEVTTAVFQLEKQFLHRLKNFYNNEISEIVKTVRLPVQKQAETFDWDLELASIMGSLRS